MRSAWQRALGNMGTIFFRKGNLDQAFEYFAAGLASSRKRGMTSTQWQKLAATWGQHI